MKLGAEPKKTAILAVLLGVAAVVFLMNSTSDGPETSATRPSPAAVPSTPAIGPRTAPQPAARRAASRSSRERTLQEFRPSLKPKKPEERADPMSIDPTLKLEVFERLQQVNVDGMRRNLFEVGQPPPPKPDPKLLAAKPKVPSPLVAGKVDPAKEEPKDTPPPKPVAPPIPLKFFGYVSPSNEPGKRAFFVEGDEIHIVTEGDLVK